MTLAAHAPVGAPATWVLSNHDVTRPVTRYGRADTLVRVPAPSGSGTPTDLALGRRRARAAALLAAALPGSLYIYQGDELGLDEVEDLPGRPAPGPDALPVRRRRSRARRLPRAAALVGRRAAVRLQPARARPPSRGCRQPGRWAALTVEAQAADPDSMLALYRAALRHPPRRARPRRRSASTGCASDPDVLAFAAWRPVRRASPTSAPTPSPLPRDGELLLASTSSSTAACRPTPPAWLARSARRPETSGDAGAGGAMRMA